MTTCVQLAKAHGSWPRAYQTSAHSAAERGMACIAGIFGKPAWHSPVLLYFALSLWGHVLTCTVLRRVDNSRAVPFVQSGYLLVVSYRIAERLPCRSQTCS